jgi:TPR repeat protein
LEQTITLNNENKINILKSDLILAIFILGQIAFNGEGLLKNYDVAFNYYSANENENHAESLNMIGVCYEKGLGTTQDEEKAYQYFLKASKLGHLGAAAKIQIINASKNINKFLNYFFK